jgi:hypothetical protein
MTPASRTTGTTGTPRSRFGNIGCSAARALAYSCCKCSDLFCSDLFCSAMTLRSSFHFSIAATGNFVPPLRDITS